jgi:glutamyl-tRNA synthetase
MYRYLGWRYPEAIHYGRLKITGASLSKSKIVQGIREGLYEDWDDPRLATFAALRRRGITPKAIGKLIVDVGPKTSDVVLSWENLYAYNRKILDPEAHRYFFVCNPVQLTVKNVPKTFTAKLRLHPDHPQWGFRKYTIAPKRDDNSVALWISKNDVDAFKVGKPIRFMGLFNIRIERVNSYSPEASFISEPYQEARKTGAPLIHWIPIGADMPCKVVMPDATIAEGIAESACRGLEANDSIQFERFGFVRIDEINTKLTAYYSHR